MKRKLTSLSTTSLFILALLTNPSSVLAQSAGAWSGRCVGTGDASDVATIQGLECLFANVVEIIVFIAGIAFLAMFVIGGFKYLTSSGDQKKTAEASSTITMAVIGLVGIILSWYILRVIQNFTGVNVTEFIIPG